MPCAPASVACRGDRAVGLRLAHPRRRLVHQQQRRPCGQRAREVHALQRAERQLGRRVVAVRHAARSGRARRALRASRHRSPRRARGVASAAPRKPHRRYDGRRRGARCRARYCSPNGSTCWNVRPMPRRLMTCAGRPDTGRRRAARGPSAIAHRPGDRVDDGGLAGAVRADQPADLAGRHATATPRARPRARRSAPTGSRRRDAVVIARLVVPAARLRTRERARRT